MTASKFIHHELWEAGDLDSNLEDLLQQYETSVRTSIGGVPAEIVQGASRIPPERDAKARGSDPGVGSAPYGLRLHDQQ